MTDQTRRILVGRIHGAFGVRGELKLESFTEPKSAILRYQPWILRDAQGGERVLDGARGRETNKGLVAVFPEIADRDAAEALRGSELWVRACRHCRRRNPASTTGSTSKACAW